MGQDISNVSIDIYVNISLATDFLLAYIFIEVNTHIYTYIYVCLFIRKQLLFIILVNRKHHTHTHTLAHAHMYSTICAFMCGRSYCKWAYKALKLSISWQMQCLTFARRAYQQAIIYTRTYIHIHLYISVRELNLFAVCLLLLLLFMVFL